MAIIKTSTGIRHTADRGFYSGEVAETGVIPVTAVKRGRGRPRKDAGESGAKFDFSAFMTNVKVPEFKGTSRVYNKMGK
jgi:hypothetical protein